MARVAVDAMGGDRAPGEIVAGAVEASRDAGIEVVLVGRQAEVDKALADAGADLPVVHAQDVVAMDDHDPARAVRSARDSSIAVACRLVREGKADAVFSAGPTGATLAAAVLEMGRMRGVPRPAVTVTLPFPGQQTVLVDAGANTEVRPEHLAGFAVLGSEFAKARLGIDNPRVGLLSVGEEPSKGNELVRAAHPLIASSGVNFVGNVEGRDIASDTADVIVCDGFVGNIVLKTLEGFSKYLMDKLLEIFSATDESRAALDVVLPGLLDLRETLSPQTAGGAQLLGTNGVCIIGHGTSDTRAVRRAIEVAAQTADAGLVARVAQALRQGGTG